MLYISNSSFGAFFFLYCPMTESAKDLLGNGLTDRLEKIIGNQILKCWRAPLTPNWFKCCRIHLKSGLRLPPSLDDHPDKRRGRSHFTSLQKYHSKLTRKKLQNIDKREESHSIGECFVSAHKFQNLPLFYEIVFFFQINFQRQSCIFYLFYGTLFLPAQPLFVFLYLYLSFLYLFCVFYLFCGALLLPAQPLCSLLLRSHLHRIVQQSRFQRFRRFQRLCHRDQKSTIVIWPYLVSRTQMTERHNNRAMCKRNIQKFRAMCHRKIKVLQNLRERWEI